MPKYLFQADYTGEGMKGIIKEGGTARKAAVVKAVKALGGKVEAFYFGFGESDVYVILDLPDNATATALALAVNGSGTVTGRTTVLLTPEEVDEATRKKSAYRAPGK